jgi:hypothetical protein
MGGDSVLFFEPIADCLFALSKSILLMTGKRISYEFNRQKVFSHRGNRQVNTVKWIHA